MSDRPTRAQVMKLEAELEKAAKHNAELTAQLEQARQDIRSVAELKEQIDELQRRGIRSIDRATQAETELRRERERSKDKALQVAQLATEIAQIRAQQIAI